MISDVEVQDGKNVGMLSGKNTKGGGMGRERQDKKIKVTCGEQMKFIRGKGLSEESEVNHLISDWS